MINSTESLEKSYLKDILNKLQTAHETLERQIDKYDDEIQEGKDYIWGSKADLDGAEKAFNRMVIHQNVASGEQRLAELRRVDRLIESPYFGRVDFIPDDNNEGKAHYIGLHSFSETAGDDILIYDWRAPISSLFYDFEKGPAVYIAPAGVITGNITRKRQYKIRRGVMEYMLESDINIDDDVLQKELSQTTNEKMKNIVVTIQREQNAIIRNSTADTLIVQGVAGSGKTSIALHRVAFLLYRNSETLRSDNMMIISPNKVFADYISNVLPELGEDNIQEIDMTEIAQDLLDDHIAFRSFSEQVDFLLHDANEKDLARIRYKATSAFAEELHAYLHDMIRDGFLAVDLDIDHVHIPADDILEIFHKLRHLRLKERLEMTANHLVTRYNTLNDRKLEPSVARKIKNETLKMFPFSDAFALYSNFYNHSERKKLFKHKKGQPLHYEDVFPLIYTKLHFEKSTAYSRIEHLLVDEMQDYTPIQYAVIRKLFSCKKTILGDSNQSVNPYTSTSQELIRSFFPGSESVKLLRSYRSTMEITELTQRISRNEELIPVERHGTKPGIHVLESEKEEQRLIRKLILEYQTSEYQSLGIICKTTRQAEKLYFELREKIDDLLYLDFDSREYRDGIIITSAHMAKGLEFDQVIVPHVSRNTYHTELDRSLLYIACTRAMHRLDLTCHSEVTEFLSGEL
ncbi:MAG: AAA family ATPase [Clostridiales bacterium]|nr:AAA family ATPase [Clostridiales bacterium]